MEVEEEQEVDRPDSSAGMTTEQSVWSLATEEVELMKLSDWETGQYSRTGQARSL